VDGWCVLVVLWFTVAPSILLLLTTFTLATSTQIILFSKMLKFYFILFPPNDKNLCKANIEFVIIFYFSN